MTKIQFTRTATQPQRNVLKYFAIFKTVARSLEHCLTPSNSPGPKLCTAFLNGAEHDAITTKKSIYLNRNETAPEPQISSMYSTLGLL